MLSVLLAMIVNNPALKDGAWKVIEMITCSDQLVEPYAIFSLEHFGYIPKVRRLCLIFEHEADLVVFKITFASELALNFISS